MNVQINSKTIPGWKVFKEKKFTNSLRHIFHCNNIVQIFSDHKFQQDMFHCVMVQPHSSKTSTILSHNSQLFTDSSLSSLWLRTRSQWSGEDCLQYAPLHCPSAPYLNYVLRSKNSNSNNSNNNSNNSSNNSKNSVLWCYWIRIRWPPKHMYSALSGPAAVNYFRLFKGSKLINVCRAGIVQSWRLLILFHAAKFCYE